MFNPNDDNLPRTAIRYVLPATAASRPIRRVRSRLRPNIVRLVPSDTRLPVGYSPR